MFSLFCCAVEWIRKDIPTKTWKYLRMLRIFLDRGTALLSVLPDWHDAIVCISSVSQFNILEAVHPLWKSDSFLWISDKKQTQPYKKSDNFNCFPAAFKLHRKRFFSWPFFGVFSHVVDLYLISNEQPSKGKKQIYLQFEGKNCSNT